MLVIPSQVSRRDLLRVGGSAMLGVSLGSLLEMKAANGADIQAAKGRGAGKAGVAIGVERRGRTAGSARLAVIPRATTAVLTSFVHGVSRQMKSGSWVA